MSDFESILAQYQPGTLLKTLQRCKWFSREEFPCDENFLDPGDLVVIYKKCESPLAFGDSLIRFYLVHPTHGKILLRLILKDVTKFFELVPATDVEW